MPVLGPVPIAQRHDLVCPHVIQCQAHTETEKRLGERENMREKERGGKEREEEGRRSAS